MKGRPPSWNPFAGLYPDTWTEVIEFGSKGRLGMPAAVRRRLTWFEKATAQGLLATVEPEGKTKLESWSDHGIEIVRMVQETIEAAATGKSDMALAALDRYMHISVEDSGRLVAPANLVSHLDPTGIGRARIIVRDDELWLWSEIMWEAQRKDRLTLLSQ